MIDKEQKLSILNEILKSNSFINSKLNSKLLEYLVHCEINGKTPSEYSIAIDVFNKDSSFNPNEDTLVRVSVYNLRKKLERYYQNMGKRTKLRVKIPKGHYEVIFFNYSREHLFDRIKNPYLVLIPIILIMIVIIIYLINNPSIKDNSENSEIFSSNFVAPFAASNNSKIISLGDDFLYFSDFSEFKTTSLRKIYRNSLINNEGEFEKFKSENESRENLKKLPFSFFNQAAVWPLPHLLRLLYKFDIEFQLKSNSSLNLNDIKGNDVFFIGSYWTLGILNQIINDLGISYNIIGKEELRIRHQNISDSTIVYPREGVPAFDHYDYCTFIKAPGPNNKTIYILVSFYATGSVGAIKYLSNDKNLEILRNSFVNNFDISPEYFFILFKSKGYNREVLSTELVQVEQIDTTMLDW